MSDYVLSATLELKDKLTAKINDAKKGLDSFRGSASGVSSSLEAAQGSMAKTGVSAVKAAADTDRLKRSLQGMKGNYAATISAKDDASGTIGRVRSGLQSLQGRAASTSVHLRDEASAGIARVKEELTGLTGKAYTAVLNFKQNTGGLSGMGEKAAGMVSGVANGMLMNTSMQMAGAAGIGFGIYDTIKSYTDFEAQMKKVQAIADVSQDDFSALTEKAKEMGAITQFSATQAGQGLEYMAMAGWKTDQMLSGLPGIMNLAAASGEDLGRVSDIVTDALSAFGLQAEDSAHFADVLAKAATNSNTNVGLMGETFKYVAPIAGALKYSVEDVGLAIGLMANSGIKASEAGTSLRSIFVRMSAPPADAAKALNALGVSTKNTDGTVKPFRQTMLDLRKAFAGLSEVDKADFASKIAGQEAMSGLLAIVNASDSDFEKLEDAMDHSDGAAAKAAATMNDNLKGALVSLSSAWESFQIEIMSGKAGEGIRSFVEGVHDDVTRFKDYIKDGLDISDVGHIAADVITQLKNKFLELDGIGSILAGGALATGLYKIIGLTKKAYEGVKEMSKIRMPGSTPSPTTKGGGASGVGSMVINASSVVVNGKTVAGGPGGTAPRGGGGPVILGPNGRPLPPSTPAPAPAPMPPTTSRGAILREFGAGAAFAGLFAALELSSTKKESEQLMKEAAYGLESATNNLQDLQNNGGTEEQILAAQEQVQAMKQYQTDVQTQADIKFDEAAGGAVGSVIGAGIGGVLMGPMGAAIGGFIGEEIGRQAGDRFHLLASETDSEKLKQELGTDAKMDDYDIAALGDDTELDVKMHVAAPDPEDIQQAIQDTEDGISNESLIDLDTNAGTGLFGGGDYQGPEGSIPAIEALKQAIWGVPPEAQAASDETLAVYETANDEIVNDVSMTGDEIEMSNMDAEANSEGIWGVFKDFFNSNVTEPTATDAAASAESITSSYADSEANTEDAWADMSSWFDGTVYDPTAEGASSCATSISTDFQESSSSTQSAWSGVGDFFAGLFTSIKSGAASCAASVARSMASAAASARSSGHTTIASGLDWVGNNLAWLGGGSYEHRASGASYYSGGWTEINEQGGEIVDLPRGSRIYPHATTIRMLKEMFEDRRPQTLQTVLPKAEMPEPVMNVAVPKAEMPEPVYKPVLSVPSLSGMLDDMAYPPEPSQPMGMQPEPAYQPELPSRQIVVNTSRDSTPASAQPPTINITGNSFTVREEADIDRIAYRLMQLIQKAQSNMNYVGQGAFV